MSDWRIRFDLVITPLFRTWWRFTRPMTLGVRALATDAEGRVLLVRHTYTKGWHLPGGGVDHGETAHAAIVREMAEEAGLEATEPPRLIGFYSNHANFRHDHVVLFRIGATRPCPPRENGEIAERAWFDPAALPTDTKRGVRRRLAEVFASAEVSPDW